MAARLTSFNVLVALSAAGTFLCALTAPSLVILAAPITLIIAVLGVFATPASAESKRAPTQRGDDVYEVLDKLGEGGMGEVFRARQSELHRFVALKRIKPLRLAEEDKIRFRKEARVLSTLTNPHTIEVFDAGIRDDGTLFYVMELLDGVDMEKLVQENGPLLPPRAIHVLRQTVLSLGEAHHQGLVHRDLKPANVMVCRYGGEYDFVKVLDFGLAKGELADGDSLDANTQADAIPGTPAFLAPESIRGSMYVDGRADLYSLGALGYYLLTGRFLFDAETPMKMVQAQLNQAPPRASEHCPHEVPAELDELLLDCLKKKPEERPATAEDLLARLEQLALSHPWTREMAAERWADVPALSFRNVTRPHCRQT